MNDRAIAGSSDWRAMYDAFCNVLGTSPDDFQLLYPFLDWDWATAPLGYTDASQQFFLDNLPEWSPIGRFQRGSLLSNAYRVWLDTLIEDEMVRRAKSDYGNSNYYTLVLDDNNPTLPAPGYAEIPSYASWLHRHHVDDPIVIEWRTDGRSFDADTWAGALTTPESSLPLIEVRHEGEPRETAALAATDIRVKLTFQAWGRVGISPLPWFSEAFVRATIRNPKAYRKGFSPRRPNNGKGGWALGEGGILPLRASTFLVARDPTFELSSAGGALSTAELQALVAESEEVRIGPYSSRLQETSFPVIFGVEILLFG